MSDRTETFEIVGTARVELYLHSGDLRLKQGRDGYVTLQMSGNPEAVGSLEVDASDEAVTVRATAKKRRWFGAGSVNTVVSLPVGANVVVHLGAGDVSAALDLGDIEVHTGSGDIRLDAVSGTADLKVGSGEIRVSSIRGSARVAAAAGDCRIGSATDITASTAAGDLYLSEVTESARVKSAAGDTRIKRFSGTDLEVKTMSGDTSIGLIPGLTVNANVKTMSGELRNRIKPSGEPKTGTMNLTVVSFVGDVTLKTAK